MYKRSSMVYFLFVLFCVFLCQSSMNSGQKSINKMEKGKQIDVPGPLTFYFIENQGQLDTAIKYHLKLPHGNVFFADRSITYQFVSEVAGPAKNKGIASIEAPPKPEHVNIENMRLVIEGCSDEVELIGQEESTAKFYFYQGNNSENWVEGAPSFKGLLYKNIYPKIDLLVFQKNGKLKQEYWIHPGGRVDVIRIRYEGVKKIQVDPGGRLEILTSSQKIEEGEPISYQINQDVKVKVVSKYDVIGENTLKFSVGPYDSDKELIIDPVLYYSTYLGGSGYDNGNDVDVDLRLNAYAVGTTGSSDFPTTPGAFNKVYKGGDAFISKFDPTGSNLLFSTYLGGSESDEAHSVAFSRQSDFAAIAGVTQSNDFPISANAYDKIQGGQDIFIARISSSGALVASTFFGGKSYEGYPEIGIDGSDNFYIFASTESPDLETTPGAFDTQFDDLKILDPPWFPDQNIFIAKFDPFLSDLSYSTFFGGWSLDATSIAVDFDGNAYILGLDHGCFQIPTTPGSYCPLYYGEGQHAFLAKLNPTGSGLVYGTYTGVPNLGYCWVRPADLAVDGQGNAYILISYDCTYMGIPLIDETLYATVAKFNPTASHIVWYKALYSEEDNDHGKRLVLDGRGGLYVLGETLSKDFPITDDAFQKIKEGGWDLFITKMATNNGSIQYSTFMGGNDDDHAGGIAADAYGSVYLTGYTYSYDFPTTPGAYSTALKSKSDAFVARIADQGPTAEISLSKKKLAFNFPQGSSGDKSKSFVVKNTGKGVMSYEIAGNQKWMAVTPTSGECKKDQDKVDVKVSSEGLKPGIHYGVATVASLDAFNNPQQVEIKMTIKGPTLKLSKGLFKFNAELGGKDPKPGICKVKNSGPGTLKYKIRPQVKWLRVKPKSGTSSGEYDKFQIIPKISGLIVGTHEGIIEVISKDTANSPMLIKVELTIEMPEE